MHVKCMLSHKVLNYFGCRNDRSRHLSDLLALCEFPPLRNGTVYFCFLPLRGNSSLWIKLLRMMNFQRAPGCSAAHVPWPACTTLQREKVKFPWRQSTTILSYSLYFSCSFSWYKVAVVVIAFKLWNKLLLQPLTLLGFFSQFFLRHFFPLAFQSTFLLLNCILCRFKNPS